MILTDSTVTMGEDDFLRLRTFLFPLIQAAPKARLFRIL